MTRERKLLLALGASLIALLIAIAAFSLGVYVGVHGWTAGKPAVLGPGPQPPAAPAPADQPAAQPGALPRPQLIGRVLSSGPQGITLETAEGLRLFQVAPEAVVVRAGDPEEPGTLDDVRPGRTLAVFGSLTGDGGRLLIAQRLVLLPPAAGESAP